MSSKWNHVLDDAEITMMMEPELGTQMIYEFVNTGDCSRNFLDQNTPEVRKVYPPNSTVIVYNECSVVQLLGEITKLVVEKNTGTIVLGQMEEWDQVSTNSIVIKSSDSTIYSSNTVASLEIQDLGADSHFFQYGMITEHVDIKRIAATAKVSLMAVTSQTPPTFDFWIEQNCGTVRVWEPRDEWNSYINNTNCVGANG